MCMYKFMCIWISICVCVCMSWYYASKSVNCWHIMSARNGLDVGSFQAHYGHQLIIQKIWTSSEK